MVNVQMTEIVMGEVQLWIGLCEDVIVFVGSPNGSKEEVHQFIKNAHLETILMPTDVLKQAFTAYFEEGVPLTLSYSDIFGTSFQQKVWQAVRTIPYGETRSYSDLARAIGMPSAVRAVASAVARNPLLLVVPCHRVIQKSGKLGNYRGGATWKQSLLKLEKSFHEPTV